MLNLYHVSQFRSTRVLWVLAELAQLYPASRLPRVAVHEFTDVAAFRSGKPEWYTAMHPLGKVPVVAHGDGRVLFEGGAVVLSILDEFDAEKRLLPDASRDLMYQLSFYCATTIDNLTATSSPIQHAVNLQSGAAPPMDPQVDDAKRFAWTTMIAPFLERKLAESEGDYLGGAAFSAVDIVLGLDLFALHERMLERGDGTSWIDETATPRLARLAALLRDRPARRFVLGATMASPESLQNMRDFGIHAWDEAAPPRPDA